MAFKLAELFVKIGARDLSLMRSLARVNASLQRTHARMQGVSRAARKMLMVGGLAVGGIMFVFGKFEKQMSRVQALTSATEEEFAKLSETARRLGMTTEHSASAAAEGMQNLALAGFNVNEIIGAMPGLLSLATAAQVGLDAAALTTATTLRALNWEASRAGEIADIMSKTATNSTQSFTQLADALSYALPLAVANNQEFTHLNAAIGVLANRNIVASRAGTSLAGIMARLSGAAQETSRFLKELGIETAGVDGKMRPLADIIGDINKQTAGMGQMEKSSKIMRAFGLRAGPAMTILLGQGKDAIEEFDKMLQKAGGTAEMIAKIQLNTLWGQLKILTSAFQEFMLKVGTALEPMMAKMIRGMQKFIGVLNSLTDVQIASMLQWAATAAAIGLAVVALSGLLFVATMVLNPLTVMVGVFVAMAAMVIKTKLEVVGFAGAVDWMGDKIQAAIDHILSWWDKWATTTISAVAWVKTVILQFGEVYTWLALKVTLFANTAADDITHWAKHVVDVFSWFGAQHEKFWVNVENFWGSVIFNMAQNWASLWIFMIAKMRGVDWDLELQPLLASFQKTVFDKIPEMADRAISGTEKVLAAGIAAIEEGLKAEHKQKFDEIMQIWGPDNVRRAVDDIKAQIAEAFGKAPQIPRFNQRVAGTMKPDSAFVGIVEMARKIQQAASGKDPLQQLGEQQLVAQKQANKFLNQIVDNVNEGFGGVK